MKRILTYSIWLDSACVVGLLSRTLFPEFPQATYFETAACLWISIITVIVFLTIGVYVAEKSKNKHTDLFGKERYLVYDALSDLIIVGAAIYSSHFIIGVLYGFLKSVFRRCVKEERKQNEQLSETVCNRRFRSRR